MGHAWDSWNINGSVWFMLRCFKKTYWFIVNTIGAPSIEKVVKESRIKYINIDTLSWFNLDMVKGYLCQICQYMLFTWSNNCVPIVLSYRTSEVWIGLEYNRQQWLWHGTSAYWGNSDYTNAASTPNITMGHHSTYMRRDGVWAFNSQNDVLKPFVCERAKPTGKLVSAVN